MKQLAILSGKGGTGKTTIAGSFIKLSKNKGFADCDVDAPNLHLTFSKSELISKEDYSGYRKAVKYEDLCIECGECEKLCRFDAIKDGVLNRLHCEGCGVCEYFCPVVTEGGKKAIRLEENISGETSLSKVEGDLFSTAQLKMGNGASGKLVTQVRKNLFGKISDEEIIIIDGSPGIGCPVIASVTGVDMVLVVTEPTVSGFSDMKRIVETAERFKTKIAVLINKYDVNKEKSIEIEEYIKTKNIKLVGRIPFDKLVPNSINELRPIVDFEDSIAGKEIRKTWETVKSTLFL